VSPSPKANDTVSNHYTFGDNARAAERLQFLSDLFRPALESFVRLQVRERPRSVLDLGCGPGHTTRALAELLAPDSITGLDHSERFLAEARRAHPDGIGTQEQASRIRYGQQDVTQPLADSFLPPSDALYARFLLTHLPEPSAALGTWAGYVRSGGLLLLQETADMKSPHPVLSRYYELVRELQLRHGQRFEIGRSLEALADTELYRIEYTALRLLRLPEHAMARLHALNIATWRSDPLAASFDAEELNELQSELTRLAESPPSTAEVHCTLGELALVRR
jgi:trans-aconitate 2-methyltransferase